MEIVSELTSVPADSATIFQVVITADKDLFAQKTNLFIIGDIDSDSIELISSQLPIDSTITHINTSSDGLSTCELISRGLNSMVGCKDNGASSMLIIATPSPIPHWYAMIPEFTAKMNIDPFPCVVLSSDSCVDGAKMLRLTAMSPSGRYIHRSSFREALDEFIENQHILTPPRYIIRAHNGVRIVGKYPKVCHYARHSAIIHVNIRAMTSDEYNEIECSQHIITVECGEYTQELMILRKESIKNPLFSLWAEHIQVKKAIRELVRDVEIGNITNLSLQAHPCAAILCAAINDYPTHRNRAYDIISQMDQNVLQIKLDSKNK